MAAILQPIDRNTWQQLAPSFSDYNYRQLWDFGIACAERLKATSEHIALYEGKEVVGLANVRIKKLPVFNTGIAYINGGPMVRCNGEDKCRIRLPEVLAGLADCYVRQKKLVLRIQPPLGPDSWNDFQRQTYLDMGYSVCRQLRPYRTIVLNLSQPLELIRKQFEQKWRNCLNNAEKKDLVIKTGTEEMFFSEFIHLYQGLIHRKDFSVDLKPEFYFQVQNKLINHERFIISIVYQDDQPVAGHVSSILGDTCVYLLGASNEQALRVKAAYLPQWHTIKLAKERGCKWYDLGGIDPKVNPGVYHFKKGMGGVDVTAPGPFECYPDGIRRMLVSGGERIYKILRGFRTH